VYLWSHVPSDMSTEGHLLPSSLTPRKTQVSNRQLTKAPSAILKTTAELTAVESRNGVDFYILPIQIYQVSEFRLKLGFLNLSS